jgi:hypothetical protein
VDIPKANYNSVKEVLDKNSESVRIKIKENCCIYRRSLTIQCSSCYLWKLIYKGTEK